MYTDGSKNKDNYNMMLRSLGIREFDKYILYKSNGMFVYLSVYAEGSRLPMNWYESPYSEASHRSW